jgi:Ser/Thr protein kinase RdoA (MazF antagonist)
MEPSPVQLASQAFSSLSPEIAMSVVEEGWNLRCDGSFFAYPSYVNRVYGLRSEDEADFVIKFYRPGRWSKAAIQEEHDFLNELAAAEVPVVPPLSDADHQSIITLQLITDDTSVPIHCALFPKKPGRSFDADGLTDMERLGALAGRIHSVGQSSAARHREIIDSGIADRKLAALLQADAIPSDCLDSVKETLIAVTNYISQCLIEMPQTKCRLHGDFHRGNILDCGGSSLVAVDFDDMTSGPAVLDLWMLLPAHPKNCPAERDALLKGYEQFMEFDSRSFRLVPALQLLRIVHYLEWQCRQRYDTSFLSHFPGWGTRSFWLQEAGELAVRLADMQAEP